MQAKHKANLVQLPAGRRWRYERRNCRHYYGNGGCLDLAARDDLPVVPCRGCRRFAAREEELKVAQMH